MCVYEDIVVCFNTGLMCVYEDIVVCFNTGLMCFVNLYRFDFQMD